MSTTTTPAAPADRAPKDRSMELQKQMIADHFLRLEQAPETK